MPNIRLMLWGVLAAILFLNYQTWMHDYEPPAAPAAQTSAGTGAASTTAAPANTLADSLPQAASAASTPTPPAAASAAPPAAVPAPAATAAEAPTAPLHVSTDVLEIGISLKGGELDQADLKEYPFRKDTPNVPVRLLSH